MINWFSKVVWLFLLPAFIVAGCEQGSKRELSPSEVLLDPNLVMPDYVSSAIEATGGLQAWTKAKELELDCVVTFYKPDGTFYLTEQHHRIWPSADSIQISAVEPKCKFVWQLSKGQFKVTKGADCAAEALPTEISSRDFAEAILVVTTAPARLLDSKVEFIKASGPVRIEGLWYYPIKRVTPDKVDVEQYCRRAVFYQNKDSSLVDMIWFTDIGRQPLSAPIAVCGYDYREAGVKAVHFPTKIEIFKTDSSGVLQQRLIKIDY